MCVFFSRFRKTLVLWPHPWLPLHLHRPHLRGTKMAVRNACLLSLSLSRTLFDRLFLFCLLFSAFVLSTVCTCDHFYYVSVCLCVCVSVCLCILRLATGSWSCLRTSRVPDRSHDFLCRTPCVRYADSKSVRSGVRVLWVCVCICDLRTQLARYPTHTHTCYSSPLRSIDGSFKLCF